MFALPVSPSSNGVGVIDPLRVSSCSLDPHVSDLRPSGLHPAFTHMHQYVREMQVGGQLRWINQVGKQAEREAQIYIKNTLSDFNKSIIN